MDNETSDSKSKRLRYMDPNSSSKGAKQVITSEFGERQVYVNDSPSKSLRLYTNGTYSLSFNKPDQTVIT